MYIELTDNINLNGSEDDTWTPIGTRTMPFAGNFNGGGFVISGLYINSNSESNQALFGYLSGTGAISNLGVSGAVQGNNVAGAIAGVNYGVISSCYNACEVSGSSYIGGIAGNNYGSIQNCYNKGQVSGTSYIGGIVGYSSEKISYSYNIGTISGTSQAGGIVGYSNGTVSNIYSLENCVTSGSGGNYGSAMSESAMKLSSFVSTLGASNWSEDTTPNINSGYPILSWQK